MGINTMVTTDSNDGLKEALPKKSFSSIIRRGITDSGQSVYSIAKATNIPQPVISRFYNGKRDNIRLDVLEKLCEYLGFTLERVSK